MGLAKGTTGVAVLLVAAGAYYWLHERASRPQPERASTPGVRPAEPSPISRDPAPEPAAVAAPRAAQPVEPSKVAAPAPGSPLRTGEILDYTADVAKVSNVANLRLQVAERRNFLGKTAWHLPVSYTHLDVYKRQNL